MEAISDNGRLPHNVRELSMVPRAPSLLMGCSALFKSQWAGKKNTVPD